MTGTKMIREPVDGADSGRDVVSGKRRAISYCSDALVAVNDMEIEALLRSDSMVLKDPVDIDR
jgi:hypothetical protein